MSDTRPYSYTSDREVETTQDVISSLVGIRSAWIHKEEQSAVPDQAKIDKWVEERGEYSQLRFNVVSMSDAEVAELKKTYQAQVRRERGLTEAEVQMERANSLLDNLKGSWLEKLNAAAPGSAHENECGQELARFVVMHEQLRSMTEPEIAEVLTKYGPPAETDRAIDADGLTAESPGAPS